jgi:hypothetical protein
MLGKGQERSMFESSNIFEENYQNYCNQIKQVNFESIKSTLGISDHKYGYLIVNTVEKPYRFQR